MNGFERRSSETFGDGEYEGRRGLKLGNMEQNVEMKCENDVRISENVRKV